MRAACAHARIKPAVGFHTLRHTWASLTTMAGVPLLVVAKNLGHTDTRMVEKHYGHMAPSFIAKAIRRGAPRFGKVTLAHCHRRMREGELPSWVRDCAEAHSYPPALPAE